MGSFTMDNVVLASKLGAAVLRFVAEVAPLAWSLFG